MVSSTESLYKALGVANNGSISNYSNPRLKQMDTNRNGQVSPKEAWEYLYAHGNTYKPVIYPVVYDLWTELQSSDQDTRLNAATRIGRLGASGAIPAESLPAVKAALVEILDRKNLTHTAYCEPYRLRAAALKALVKMGAPEGKYKAVEVLTRRWGPLAVNDSRTVMLEAVNLIKFMSLNGKMSLSEAESVLGFVRGQHGFRVDWPVEVRRAASLALVDIRAKYAQPLSDLSYEWREGFLWLSKANPTISMKPSSVLHNLRAVNETSNTTPWADVPRTFNDNSSSHVPTNRSTLSDEEVMSIQAALYLVGRLPAKSMAYANRDACVYALGELQLDYPDIKNGFNGSVFGVDTKRHLADEVAKFIKS